MTTRTFFLPDFTSLDDFNRNAIQELQPASASQILDPNHPVHKMQRIADEIMSWDVTNKLWQQAVFTPNPFRSPEVPERQWMLISAPKGHVLNTFGGRTIFNSQAIVIDTERPYPEALATTIFELTNVKKAPIYHQLDQDLLEGKISVEKYARANEWQEYLGKKEQHKIILLANITIKWDTGSTYFGEFSWKEYVQYNERNGHTDEIRSFGKKLVRKRVHDAMKSVGYTRNRINSFDDGQLENISYKRNHTALVNHLHEMRTVDEMHQIGFSPSEIGTYTPRQLILFSTANKTGNKLRAAILRERVDHAMRTLQFSETQIRLFRDDFLSIWAGQTDSGALGTEISSRISFLAARKRRKSIVGGGDCITSHTTSPPTIDFRQA